jgi:hypothetical protein
LAFVLTSIISSICPILCCAEKDRIAHERKMAKLAQSEEKRLAKVQLLKVPPTVI